MQLKLTQNHLGLRGRASDLEHTYEIESNTHTVMYTLQYTAGSSVRP